MVSNREPYLHVLQGDEIRCQQPASGLTAALDPVMQACGGTWVAHGSGDADRMVVDEQAHVRVPPHDPKYLLRRVWLTKEEEDGYYYGFANEALWPLCHIAYTRPTFNEADWQAYVAVNRKFADAVAEEVGGQKAFIFIQDYHFTQLSRLIKARCPNTMTAQFWHIPWPNREAFRICPWGEEILDGLLGNDLLGFHLQHHAQNFMDTVDRGIEAKVDYEQLRITRGGRQTLVRPFPISVDFARSAEEARGADVAKEMQRLTQLFGLKRYEAIGLGVDRIDYTKGIPERLHAIDRFLQRHPEHAKRFVFIQVGVPSRVHIGSYQALNDRLDTLIEEINWRHRSDGWQPIVYLKEHQPRTTLLALYRLARFALVSSLHDGMNLVAKEFVAARDDEDGILILSPFTGAARELTDALLVNPYAADHLAQAIHQALTMSADERRRRMQRLRQTVREYNIYRWAGKVLSALLSFEFKDELLERLP
ncbi:MAG: trehalose-6-phosphate synthase [Candidatus Omnitrophica bacterium]|nr:trehalose-6-phosphate synthase [Candidatus Omnitrophota bacterium]